jgi:hypothetical protein
MHALTLRLASDAQEAAFWRSWERAIAWGDAIGAVVTCYACRLASCSPPTAPLHHLQGLPRHSI